MSTQTLIEAVGLGGIDPDPILPKTIGAGTNNFGDKTRVIVYN